MPLLPPDNLITPVYCDDLDSSTPHQQVTHPRRMGDDIFCEVQEYDQSHFNKDFKAFTGHSPTGYLHLRRQVYAENALVDQLFLRNPPTE